MRTARLGATIEFTWHWVKDTLEAMEKKFTGAYLGMDPITGQLRASRSSKMLVNSRKIPQSEYVLEIAKTCRGKIAKEDITHAAAHLSNVEAAEAYSEVSYITEVGLRDWRHERQKPAQQGMNDPEALEGTSDVGNLLVHYKSAFGLQQLFIDQITSFLENDVNVKPFVERLQEIIELRKAGINEYPGLLETLNTLITQQEIERQTSSLEGAIERAGLFKEDLTSFTRRVLTQESSDIHGASTKDFAAILRGVKMSFRAIVGQGQLTEDDFITTIVSQLDSVQDGRIWRDAHEADAAIQVRAQWRQLTRDIRRYERRGRVPDYLLSSRKTVVEPSSSRGARKRRAKRSVPILTTNEIQDVVTPPEQIMTGSRLAVMKSKAGGNEHTLEYVESLDEFMEHSLVVNFLGQGDRPDRLTGPLRDSLLHVSNFPTHFRISRVLIEQFSVDDPNCKPHTSYRLRRFKPDGNIVDLSDPLARRLRIIYGAIPSTVGNLLTVKTITLRDENTY